MEEDRKKESLSRIMRDEKYLQQRLEEHNARVHELNKPVIRLMEKSPVFARLNVDKDGISNLDFDASTKELLRDIKKHNQALLESEFADLYEINSWQKKDDEKS